MKSNMKLRMKKLLTLVLSVCMIASMNLSAAAAMAESPAASEGTSAAYTETSGAAQTEAPAESEAPESDTAAPTEESSSEDGSGQTESEPGISSEGASESISEGGSEGSSDAVTEDGSEDTSEDQTADSTQETEIQPIDNATELKDGTYAPEEFTFTGGTGKVQITCDTVRVIGGKALAVICFSSTKYTKVQTGGEAFASRIKNDKAQFTIPIDLNTDQLIIATTVAMSEPHDIEYVIHVTLDETQAETESSSDETSSGESSSDETSGSQKTTEADEPTETSESDKPAQKLKNGIYTIKAETDNRMFYVYPKDKPTAYLVVDGKKLTVTFTLTGQGYDYLYLGTVEEAEHAKKSAWIPAEVKNGYYSYTTDIPALDKWLSIACHSSRYNAWRSGSAAFQHTIRFLTKGAKKIGDLDDEDDVQPTVPDKKNEKPERSDAAESTTAASSTRVVNSSTTLADGVYKPDATRWSGGSGRLAYIRCNKITVRGGKAYATIEFSTGTYTHLKASGSTYSNKGGGSKSIFEIPIELNKNNTIIGRTVAMSQPHWVQYSIYVYLAAAGKGGSAGPGTGADTEEIAEEAPEIIGLETAENKDSLTGNAEYVQIFEYGDGIKLVQIDVSKGTALEETETEEASESDDSAQKSKDAAGESAAESESDVEYDEDGNVITKTQMEITNELYQNPVINYLIVPEDVEVPAGLDKEMIIIKQPKENTFTSSNAVIKTMERLGLTDRIKTIGIDASRISSEDVVKAIEEEKILSAGTIDDMDYRTIVSSGTDLTLLPATVLPAAIPEMDEKTGKALTEEEIQTLQAGADEQVELLRTLQSRFTALGIPVMIDRSHDEEYAISKLEWLKVYGAIFGCYDEAEALFDKIVKARHLKPVEKDKEEE